MAERLVVTEHKEAVEQASACGKSQLDVFSVGLFRMALKEEAGATGVIFIPL